MRTLMGKEKAQEIAAKANLGTVYFQFNTAMNTGQQFEVGYVRDGVGGRNLFCKRGSSSTPDDFYLCNDFEKLDG